MDENQPGVFCLELAGMVLCSVFTSGCLCPVFSCPVFLCSALVGACTPVLASAGAILCSVVALSLAGAVAEGAVSAALAKPAEARNMEVNSKVAIFFMVNALSGQVKSHMACIQPGRYCINRKHESGYGVYPIIR